VTITAITTRRGLFRLLGAGGTTVGLVACSAHSKHDKHGKHGDKNAPSAGTVATDGPLGAGPLDAATTTEAPATIHPMVSGPPTIMIIRHAEKPDAGKPQGVTVDGATDQHSLVVAGWARAGALVGLFAPGHDAPPAGLLRPDAVYAGFGGASDGLRPLQTVVPLAARLRQNVVTRYGKGDEQGLATELTGRAGATLVSWQHDAIPDIVAHLGQVDPAPPTKWPGERFDLVWVFTRNGAGWRFQQIPQLLLAGDVGV
jgi:broad specificity phosphatase PhoE